ncbi:MAG: HPF/RaiA family ribosome-associated protein [Deltaproteobacteria bacterium]|nr:HPF/RaiA family ribosome-associated protein [Deltaproteobacteria bacterium]
MTVPLQITFRNMPPTEAIEAHIREKAAKLDQFYDRVMSCRVVMEVPHRRHHKGKLYHVRVDIKVPGWEVVINREPTKHSAHEDVYVSVQQAFDAARRQLQDYARRQRGEVKGHEGVPIARVSKLFADEGYGFLETADGREIYFHRNSVLDGHFEHMDVGTEVHFAEEDGERGTQASTVRHVGKHYHHKRAVDL